MASNPFYDRQCNNELVKMQRLTLDHLNQMVGVEYILLHAQEPILYIIRKQQRQSPAQVIPLSDYYIIAGVVYQAPDLGSVIGSRVVKKAKPKSKKKEEPSSLFQRQRVDALLLDLRQKFPPIYYQPKPGEKPIPVEVKKEPEPPTETVKQEEREPAAKTPAPTPPNKAPPEKRARL
ncbi:mediator of RNA polymerase II transcription subunit 6-like, partial [Scleropages formosus]